MKKSIYPKSSARYRNLTGISFSLIAMLFNFLPTQLNGQCSLACNSFSQISLNEVCETEVTSDMILNADQTSCPAGSFLVTVKYGNGTVLPTSPFVTKEHIGLSLTVEVRDVNSQNRCWGNITVEDKMPPVIECVSDTLYCYEAREYLGPNVSENCDSFDIVLLNEVIEPLNCDEDFVKRVFRTYVAIDEYGNESPACTQEIVLLRFPHGDAYGPQDYSVAEDNPLECQNIIKLDQNGNPHPDVTGVPEVDEVPLWPNQDFYCNLNVSYEDVNLQIRGCVRQVMRLWTIREWWCSEEVVTAFTQVIEIVDNQGPTVEVPADMTVTTSGRTCEATVNLPAATVFDSCSLNNVSVDITYPGGFLQGQNGGVVTLPVGENEIVYTAYDACYNSTTEIMIVLVEDHTAPVAVCDQHTVVGLTYDGYADVYAQTFDDGSYDDCWIDSMAVRRMDNGGVCAPGSNVFAPFASFCCEDIAGGPITVVLRVWDEFGNFNDCMVQVEVQDKLPPSITCPPDLTISCDYHLDRNDLSDFGTVVESKDAQQPLAIAPPYLLDWDGLLIDGLAHDNCQINISEDVEFTIDQCNVGFFTRVFTAVDPNGFASCTQVVTIENVDPFTVNSFDPLDPTDDVIWPLDYETSESCNVGDLTPDALSAPYDRPELLNEDHCDLVGVTYSDQTFPFAGDNACFKIIRTWKIIDWCQQGSGSYFEWTYQQVIKVHNLVAPEITSSCAPVSVETFDPNCEDGLVELVATATDDCTPDNELANSYAIDLYNTGVFGTPVNGVGPTIDASGEYPVGVHSIKYSFEDKCGNKVSCTQEFEIISRKAPTAYCVNGIIVELMPMDLNNDGQIDDGMVEIWAEDFDAGSSHTCGYDLTFSFDPQGLELGRIYNCDSLSNGPVLDVVIYITDEQGNQASCTNTIEIQDNQNACTQTIQSAVIGGKIATEQDEFVADVSVSLQGSAVNQFMTKNDGSYAFPPMPYGGTYAVVPGKNNDHQNGISTADIVHIQKYLLGNGTLDSPYKLIAADANGSGDISARDIIELRRLILGLTNELPNSPSWRFVDKSYKFADPSNPFATGWPEIYDIKGLNGHMMSVDFTAVKVGDVNNSASANANSTIQTRSNANLLLQVDDQEFVAGELVEVPVTSEFVSGLEGYQFTLNFNNELLSFESWESGKIQLSEANISAAFAQMGMITTSWNGTPVSADGSEILFTLKFRAVQSGSLSEQLFISSDITAAESVTVADGIGGVKMEVRSQGAANFTLYQNTPNPFSHETVIRFALEKAEPATLTIYDVNGKVLLAQSFDGVKGMNEFTLNAGVLQASGVLYYQLDTRSHSATKRMILLQ